MNHEPGEKETHEQRRLEIDPALERRGRFAQSRERTGTRP